MKRSEINRRMREAKALFSRHGIALPPRAARGPEDIQRCPAIEDDKANFHRLAVDCSRFLRTA